MTRRPPRSSLIAATALATAFATVAPPAAIASPAPIYADAAVAPAKPVKFTDTCAPLRQPFQRAKDHVRNETVKGFASGMVKGLFVGGALLLLGGGGDAWKKILIPTLTIGFAEGLSSYLQAKQQQARTQAELQAVIAGDVDNDMRTYSSLAHDLAALGDCRRAQIYDLRRQVEARTLGAAEARVQLAAIQKAASDDDTLVSAAANVQTERVQMYTQAYGIASGYTADQVKAAGDTGGAVQESEVAQLVPAVYVARADTSGALQSESLVSASAPLPPPVAVRSTSVRYVQGKRTQHLMGEPGVGSAILIDVPTGEAVEVTGPASDPAWSQVRWNGKSGYLMTASLASEEPSVSGKSAATSRKRSKGSGQVAGQSGSRPAPAPAAPRKELTGPRRLQVATIKASATDTPKQHIAAAIGSARTLKVVLAQNKAATASDISDAMRAIERAGATNS